MALAFGLTVLTMAYAIGHISGCHLNPAVTVGLWAGERFPAGDLLPYIVAQVLGGIVGAGVLLRHRQRQGRASTCAGGFASNGYGDHSPGGYSLRRGLVTEVVMTFVFLVDHPGRDRRPRAEGLRADRHRPGLTLIHLIGIPVTNTSVNPARSTGPALFVGGWALAQLWLFWVAPIVGAAIAGLRLQVRHRRDGCRAGRDDRPAAGQRRHDCRRGVDRCRPGRPG